MSKILDEAYAESARCLSLACTRYGRDAVYDLQLVPVENGGDITYTVQSQYGRRGARATPFVACTGVSLTKATWKYVEIVTEKKTKKHYYEVPLARESLAVHVRTEDGKRARQRERETAAVEAAQAPGLPDWQGFEGFVVEAAMHLTARWRDAHRAVQGACAVILADFAYNASEGLVDAVAQVKGAGTDAELQAALSPQILEWLAVHPLPRVLRELREGAVAL